MPQGSRMARAVAGRSVVSAVARGSVPGFRGWASSQPSAAGPGCGWTSGGEDAGVSGLRDFLPVAVESGGLRSITL
jgi:hypothetical protein